MPNWPNRARRTATLQGLALGLTAAVLWWLAHNTADSLDRHGISLGFGFLTQPANFEIGDTAWLPFSPENSIARAIAVGLLNTARVSALGSVLAVCIGFVVGVLRLSRNPALSGLMRACVELVRNTPLLLLLLFLSASLHSLPPARDALHPAPGLFLSDRGLVVPSVAFGDITLWLAAITLISLVLRRRLGAAGWRVVAAAAIALGLSLIVRRPAVELAHSERIQFHRRHDALAGVRRARRGAGAASRRAHLRSGARRDSLGASRAA